VYLGRVERRDYWRHSMSLVHLVYLDTWYGAEITSVSFIDHESATINDNVVDLHWPK